MELYFEEVFMVRNLMQQTMGPISQNPQYSYVYPSDPHKSIYLPFSVSEARLPPVPPVTNPTYK